MTENALHLTPSAAWPAAVLRRATGLLAVVLVWLLGWLVLAHQNDLLWQRLTPVVTERFVADSVAQPLPRLSGAPGLLPACGQAPREWVQHSRAALRAHLAECLDRQDGLVNGPQAEAAIARYEQQLKEQIDAAQAWIDTYRRSGAGLRQTWRDAFTAVQRNGAAAPDAWLGRALDRLPATWRAEAIRPRESVGRSDSADDLVTMLEARVQATRQALPVLAALPQSERLRGLALRASGLQLLHDYGQAPPQPLLATDRSSLAETMEWMRKAQGFQARGFSLAELHALPTTLFASSLVLMLVAVVAGRGRLLSWALWGAVTVLLGVGALVLTDLAVTGDPSLRYLVERQFLRFGLGDAAVPLLVKLPLGDGHLQAFWWPMLGVACLLPLLGLLRDGSSRCLTPLAAWVRASEAPAHGVLPMAMLLIAGVLAVLLLGMPAAISEGLILLGVLGLATYLARQAPLASLGGGLHGLNLGVVVAALCLAIGGSVLRGDLGHALVAVLLAGTFLLLFGGALLRALIAVLLAAGLVVLAWSLWQGAPVGPLAWVTEHLLPPHAQDRVLAMFDRFHVAASDLARVRWLIDSAGLQGWGPGYVPWQGLSQARLQDGLPLQGPSDYVPALVSALWGRAGGMALMGIALCTFVASAALGLHTALRAAMPQPVRLLAAVGGFGCSVMAFKIVLSLGGVTGVLPLTGLPVALVGYGPVTHLAALGYLLLALGTAHLRPQLRTRGVDLVQRAAPAGAVRQRGRAVLGVAVGVVALLLVAAERHLAAQAGRGADRHTAQARLDLAQAIAQSLVPDGDAAPAASVTDPSTAVACPSWQYAVDAWNARLATLARPVHLQGVPAPVRTLHLDGRRLLDAVQPASTRACRAAARSLGQMLDTDFSRLLGRQVPADKAQPGRLAAFERPRPVGAQPLDYGTANAWWGQPGCLVPAAGGQGAPCVPLTPGTAEGAGLSDVWLQRELAPQLYSALRQPLGQRTVNGRAVATGPALGLTLDPALQQQAQRIADCFTGRLRGEACTAVLPVDAEWQRQHFQIAGALRAGALGLVLVEVTSGRVMAMAGAISDCTLSHLGRSAQPDGAGRLPALLGDERCAQWPDRRSSWLALQHPALWMFPGGSSIKPLSVVAGIDAGLISPAQDAYWKGILAESHERLPVQRVALAAGQHYLDMLGQVGFDQPALDLMWGGTVVPGAAAPLHARWPAATFSGMRGLRPTSMSLADAERIRAEKLAGINVDQRYGPAVIGEFLAARRLADAALGGNDTRVSALGLAQMWRGLDLRANGADSAPALHLVEQAGVAPAGQALGWASRQAAQRVLDITSGVAASAWKGTAQGSCRHVFGACPAQGLPGVSGKTGSADFLLQEDSPYVKPGQQIPAKVYGGVFTAADGKRYAVAATALRVREGASRTLELSSSAPAEAAFTLMRAMGVRSPATR